MRRNDPPLDAWWRDSERVWRDDTTHYTAVYSKGYWSVSEEDTVIATTRDQLTPDQVYLWAQRVVPEWKFPYSYGAVIYDDQPPYRQIWPDPESEYPPDGVDWDVDVEAEVDVQDTLHPSTVAGLGVPARRSDRFAVVLLVVLAVVFAVAMLTDPHW